MEGQADTDICLYAFGALFARKYFSVEETVHLRGFSASKSKDIHAFKPLPRHTPRLHPAAFTVTFARPHSSIEAHLISLSFSTLQVTLARTRFYIEAHLT